MNFDQFNLDSRLQVGINKAGYETPTPIQVQAIPLALQGMDIIGTAQTGTGKTAAIELPILKRLLTNQKKQTRALIITPTRELAEQIHQEFRLFSIGTGIRSTTVYGGVGANPQVHALRSKVEIVVACPGRLLDLIQKGDANLQNIEMLVLDEADRMLDMGFLPDVKRILKNIPNKRQTMLFSATFPKEIESLAKQTLQNPKRVSIGLARPAHTVSHSLYPVPKHLKTKLLIALLRETKFKSVLVFTRTKHRAQKLSKQIGNLGYRTTSLHSNRTQNQRQSALRGFKSGQSQIMVATDIAARGLDIESISHVVNYDIPDTADAYIHRIGRTGRAERTGKAFTFVTDDDDAMVRTIEKIMDQKLPRLFLEEFDYAVPKPKGQPNQKFRRNGNYNRTRPKNNNNRSHRSNKPKKSFSKSGKQNQNPPKKQ